jgi:hypothetical protein
MTTVDVQQTIQAASDAASRLAAHLDQSLKDEDTARNALAQARQRVLDYESDLQQARQAEVKAVTTLGLASARRKDWQDRAKELDSQVRQFNDSLTAVQAAAVKLQG